jgi:acetyltransferase-like isoleucine patch superfamily enzyme
VVFHGSPNYISTKVWLDSTDYSLIEIGDGVTISSFVRLLTHDWSATTVLRGLGHRVDPPVGRIASISIGHHSFIGTGTVVMPGAHIGHCVIIGAGSVVRGDIPDYAVAFGSPLAVTGDSRKHVQRYAEALGIGDTSLTSESTR